MYPADTRRIAKVLMMNASSNIKVKPESISRTTLIAISREELFLFRLITGFTATCFSRHASV